MATLQLPTPITRHDLRMALIVTRREVRDSFRDWRIIIPIVILTLVFPGLANFTAARLVNFTEQFGADLISERLVPFLLLVVGFFPMSFSLVIALETFAGEKERKSLEPLLATPLTNTQLYIGKMLAAVIPPMSASYLGILVYLTGLRFSIGWVASPALLLQILTISTVQGIIMVAGAVVVSSQTTSVRAANLLASFIIIPIALLVQFEAAVMFWGDSRGLWWLMLALAMTAVVLMRMGVKIFNREELLGRDIDDLNLRWIGRTIWNRFTGRSADGRYPSVRNWYRQLFALLPQLRQPAGALLIALLGGLLLGTVMANIYSLPRGILSELSNANIADNIAEVQGYRAGLPTFIFLHNLRVLTLASLVGVFTFGVVGIVIFFLPWSFIAYLVIHLARAGHDPVTFTLATILPHATVELPALLLASAAALRWHIVMIAPPPNRTVSESWLLAAADFGRVMVGLVIPLLILAAFVEAFVTPAILLQVYGG
jgi:uncharacterized membrane protein SpoIIM required for sporulation